MAKTKKKVPGEMVDGKCVCPVCDCRCYCKGGLLMLLGLLGLLQYFGVVNLSGLAWGVLEPALVLILGILTLLGICCNCGR